MTIECTACHARYTIADALVPAQGARVKCKKCGEVFSIKPPAAIPAPTDVPLVPPTPGPTPTAPAKEAASAAPSAPRDAASPPAPAPPAAPAVHEPSHATAAFEHFVEPSHRGPGPSAPPAASAAAPQIAAPQVAAPPVPASGAETEPAGVHHPGSRASILPAGTPIPDGLSPEERQRHERARRLARVLASDIAIYNREKRDRGIHDGNLVAVLGYEIKKSWDIYKERVGADFANGTPYFRDALNEIVAEGRKIF